MRNDVRSKAASAGDNPIVEWGARVGYAANGLIHLVIGWLAVQVAFGEQGKADQTGALGTLASQPFGAVLLWICMVGFVLLSIWQLTEVATRTETLDRGKAAAKAVLYAALAYTTFKFASGGRSSSSKQTKDFTATLMEQSFGQILVGLIGLVVIGVGGYHIYKGWKEKFLEDLQEHPGKWAVIAGKVGYIAKGVALIVVGFLFLTAAVKHKPGQSTGLDGALKELRDAPGGQFLLLAVGLGIALYGVYSFARARYADV